MSPPLSTLRRFAAARHRYHLAGQTGSRLWTIGLVFIVSTIITHLLFSLFPYTFFILIWDILTIAAITTALGTIIDVLIFRRPSQLSTVRAIETAASEQLAHPLLSLALELSANENTENELYRETYERAASQLSILSGAIPKYRFSKGSILTVTLVMSLTATLFTARPLLCSFWQLPFSSLNRQQLAVFPGTIHLPRGASVTLGLHPEGEVTAPSCRIEITGLDHGGSYTRKLYPDSLDRFTTRIDSIPSSFIYTFLYGTTRCATETVTVVPPPLLTSLQVNLSPPRYSGQPERTLPEGQGDFNAYSGTRAAITITSSPLRAGSLLFGNDTIPLSISEATAHCTLTVRTDGAYTFALTDTFLQNNDTLPSYTIGVIPDEPPSIRFLRPGKNALLKPAQVETLLVEATDDLGVRAVSLYYYTSGDTGKPTTLNLSPDRPQPLLQRQFIWKLSRLSLYPGDTVFYWARCRDTHSPVPRTALSDTFFYRLPTFDEIHKAMARRESSVNEQLSSVQKRQNDLMRHLEQLDKATSGPEKQAGWEEQQLAEKIETLMQAQADSLQSSLEQLKENVEQLRNEGVLGEDIARKMDEIRKTMEELIRQYGDSLLFNRNDQGEITMDDMRKAVDKLKEALPELSERLDNTLQYLEAIKRDRELANLAMRSEKLAREQAQLSEENNAESMSAARQKDLLSRIDQLRKDIKSTASKGNLNLDSASSTLRQIDSLSAAMQKELSEESMASSGSGRRMSAALTSMAQQLHEKTSAYRQEQLEALRRQILDLAGDAISMANWQRRLFSASNPSGNDTDQRRLASEQQALHEALGHFGRSMDSLPLLAPSLRQQLRGDLGAAQNAATMAVSSMGESDGSFGMQLTEQTLGRLAGKLLDIAGALGGKNQGSCNSPGGMQESLRKMSGRQAAVNSATAQLLRSMMQGKLPGNGSESANGEGNEAARKEAQQAQKAIADELKQLGEKFGDTNGEGMRKRIQQLEEEARSLSRMLQEPREEVTERQDRFLARMLQSALSLHREEEGKEERQSKSAEVMFTPTTGAISDSAVGKIDLFQLLRRKALTNGNYPLSYRNAINRYFDSLGVLYLRESGTPPPQE